jgi:nitrite reductase/ring-hydroxylating ferredoxin subunit
MDVERRSFLAAVAAGTGLVLSYGLFAAYAVSFLFPPPVRRRPRRLFLGRLSDFRPGEARSLVDDRGRTLLVIADGGTLTAFDTRCPHLGCQVHWEPKEARFVCPCHLGMFDRDGVAFAGPPAAAHQALTRVPLDVDAVSGTIFLRSDA